ncbi:MAG TPA: hypothetical protein VL371_23785 [Gemmataceae bacterium]|nr:hypothetical protein [Gemmataceae bacterium]
MSRRVPVLSAVAIPFLVVFAGGGTAAPPPEQPRHAPQVFGDVEVVRKTPHGYLVSPAAVIPFVAEVGSDHPLTRVAYIVTAARLGAGGKAGPEGKEQSVPVGGFVELLRRGPVRQFRIAADDASSALDLGKLSQLFREPGANPELSHYRLRVCLEATSNDRDNDPRTGRSEPVTFVVISELELLSEIGKEEELLQHSLEDRAADRLRRARFDFRKLNDRLASATPEQFPGLDRRAEEVAEAVGRASESVQDVHADFRRIVRELRANRVRAAMIDRVEKTARAPLDDALRREFVRAAEAMGELRKRLDGDDAEQARKAGAAAGRQLDALVGRLSKVVDGTKDLVDLNQNIRMLLRIEQNTDR